VVGQKNQQAMNNSTGFIKRPEITKHGLRNNAFAPPSLQPSPEAFAVPLPPDLEDEGLPMSENMIERKPNSEHNQLKKQYHEEQNKVRQIPEEGIDPPHSYSSVSLCALK